MKVDVVAMANGSPSGVGAVFDVFDAANKLFGDTAFEIRCLGVDGEPIRLRGGLRLAVEDLSEAAPAPWVVVPGIGATTPELMTERLAEPDIEVVADWLKGARHSTLVGACTATFVLGRAGALDNRSCTTTWWLAGLLGTLFPLARVDADRMVVQDGRTWTGGASFSQIDLALAIVEHHHGTLARAVANRLAFERRLSQADFVTASGYAASPEIAAIESYVLANLTEPITLADLASEAGVSARTLSRRTTAVTGRSPMQLVQHIRLQVALEKLRTSREPALHIAHSVGLADAASLYRLVKQTTGRTPSQFRAQ
ncbi:helix-turn-helix domain-containing protein [Actinocrispum sp. NPDC049592]|uniref:GlxA family transcriptional regulator n=1 Tax=Actinocrispum sp. NPDC049592 TaxID=3154835 RepID=UPI00341A752A